MQSSEREAQIGFVLRAALFLLRYGYGDLTFRKCFLYWGTPSALGIAGEGKCMTEAKSIAHPSSTGYRLSLRAIHNDGFRFPVAHHCSPSNPNGL